MATKQMIKFVKTFGHLCKALINANYDLKCHLTDLQWPGLADEYHAPIVHVSYVQPPGCPTLDQPTNVKQESVMSQLCSHIPDYRQPKDKCQWVLYCLDHTLSQNGIGY